MPSSAVLSAFISSFRQWKTSGDSFLAPQRVQRFSRDLVEHVRALSLPALRQAMANDADGNDPLLRESQLRAVMHRRRTFLEYVDALASINGPAEVYHFR